MREILFRGKRVDNGEWVEGFFVSQANDTYIFEPLQVNHGIDIGGYLDCCRMQEVIPETVGQFTGLYDNTKWEELTYTEKKDFYDSVKSEDDITIKYESVKKVKRLWKGKKIFEGDIVKGTFFGFLIPSKDFVFDIGWHQNVAGYKANYFDNVEVIGNIHDNSELLKEGAE